MEKVDSEFLKFWNTLSTKPDTTIRFFDRGENFTVHFCDAIFIAQNFYKNSGSVRTLTIGGRSVPSLLIPKKDKDIFRFILLSKQYRVELYSLENGEWILSNQASPGNLTEMEDYLFLSESESEDSTLLSIFAKFSNDECVISLAFCHLEDHRFIIGQFVDSSLLPNLETAILQLGVKECIVPSGLLSADANTSKLKNSDRSGHLPYLQMVLERSSVLITELDKSLHFYFRLADCRLLAEYFSSDPSDELNMLLKHNSATSVDIPNLFQAKSELAESFLCLGAIFKFLRLQSNEALAHTFTLSRFSLDNHVRLDSAALNALHLLPTSGESVNKYDSVYGVLNHCRTPQGQRLLTQWLRQPLTDVAKINERLDLVEAFVEDSSLRHTFHETFLRRVPDLPRLARRLQMSKAKLQDVYRVYRVVGLIPEAINHLQRSENRHSALLDHVFVSDLRTAAENFGKFTQMIESTLDLEAAKENEFLIRPDFDEELKGIKECLQAVEADIFREFEEIASKVGLEPGKSIKLESADGIGHFLRVTLKMEKQIRGISWLKKIDMQKAGVRCRSTELAALSEQHTTLKEQYSRAQKSIVKEVLTVAAGYLEPLYALGNCTAQLDVVVSLAIAAVSAPQQYIRPRFPKQSSNETDGGGIRLRDFRHPCLEYQDGVSVIPNDVDLERGKQIFKTITGPNMGGKSTYIRGTGVVVAMAQAGSFVPATEADLVPVDAIMARVGAADCQLRGISTFMAEMLETVAVLRLATRDSLVIIDELGRGTSTYDGFGLAWAISAHLARTVGCFTLFATHFHELTSLTHLLPGVVANYRVSAEVLQHASVADEEENPTDVIMLYKVEPGICDQSYGLQVARSIGLPADLVSEAEAASAEEEKVESMWVRLGERMYADENMPLQSQSECSQMETDSLSAVVVAERLRVSLENIFDQALSESEDEFGTFVGNLANEMLNQSSLGLDQPVKELLMEI